MRTKTLLLTAALSAAGIATSLAQGGPVYSVNAVGYVNVSIPNLTTPARSETYAALNNPLDNSPSNLIGTIIPSAPGDTTVYAIRADGIKTETFISDPPNFVGWFPNETVLNPGEGFYIALPRSAPNPTVITFVGQVQQGQLAHDVGGFNPATKGVSFQGSQVPQNLRLGSTGKAGTLEFPANGNMTVHVYNTATQNFDAPWAYIDGFGWFNSEPALDHLDGPSIPVAGGFFAENVGTVQSWTRTFNVN